MNTNIKKLKDIAKEIKPGITLTRFKVEDDQMGEVVKVLSIKDINQDSMYLPDEVGDGVKIQDASVVEKFLLRDGDVVISTKGSAIKTVTFRGSRDVVANGNLTVIRCDTNVLPEYLTVFFKSERTIYELQKISKGTAILNITVSDLGKILVPVPPVEIQKKIVTLFQELETYTSSRLEEVKVVKQMVLQKTEQLLNN